MAKNVLTVASRKRLQKRMRLTPFQRNSRVINQFKQKNWNTFCLWIERQKKRGLLILDKGESPHTITMLRFNYRSHARHGQDVFNKAEVYLALAELIKEVGSSEGLKHNLMVFYRYISSSDHSNLYVDFKALKRQLSKMIHED